MSQTPFALYVRGELKTFKWLAIIFSTIIIGLGFGVSVFYLKTHSDQIFLKSMAPYLSTLVESQDRPELMRILSYVSAQRGAKVRIVQDDLVLATSESSTEIDLPIEDAGVVGHLFDSEFSKDFVFSEAVLKRDDGPETSAFIVMATPIKSILGPALLATLLVGLGGLVTALAFSKRLDRALSKSMEPIEKLDRAIRTIEDENSDYLSTPFEISELENTRRTLVQTRDSLADARDRLIEGRAKELTAEAYRRLLHDLHNPVAALSRMTELSLDPETPESDKAAIVKSVGKLAQEILRQVSVNKQNISNLPKMFEGKDLRTTISAATETVRHAHIKSGGISLEEQLPPVEILAAHDPDLLRRAISNLVSNAVEACKSKVKVAVQALENEITISVADDGPGLNTDQLTIFLQGRGRSTKADRDAVGLASVNHIVNSHGGRLVYRKSDLGGACFEVRLRGLA